MAIWTILSGSPPISSAFVGALALTTPSAMACQLNQAIRFDNPAITQTGDITDANGVVVRIAGAAFVSPKDRVSHLAIALGQGAMRGYCPLPELPDRYGRINASVLVQYSGGRTKRLAFVLIRAGAAVAAMVGEDKLDREALIAEAAARAAKTGLWAAKFPAIEFTANDRELAAQAGSYRIVTGRVLSTGQTEREFFINFGSSWRDDFTVIVAKDDMAAITALAAGHRRLVGKMVRARGWITLRYGPAIIVDKSGQLELLSR